MSKSIIRILGIAGIAALLQAATALAQAEDARSAEEIVSCVAANILQGDELRSITLVTRDRAGAERKTRAKVFGRRTSSTSRTRVRFTAPPDLVGSEILVLQEEDSTELWIHSPDLGRRRLETGEAAGQSLFATGLSYEDLMRLMGLVETEAGRVRRLGDGLVVGHATYVLESVPEPGTSAYVRTVTSVDMETCVPLEMKLYERIGSAPRKVIMADRARLSQTRGVWTVRSAILWDHRDETRTVLQVESFMPYADLPDTVFSPEDLGKAEPEIDIEVKFEPSEPELIEKLR